MYDMKNDIEIKEKKLDRIVTIRFTDVDYNALLNISETKGSDISKVIRTIAKPIVDLTIVNNHNDK